MQLSVIIVSYNVSHYLMQCLDSVERATRGIESEVWVVDNASTDDSVARVRERYPSVLMMANTENVGFARANNMAIRQATGDYILLLNPDTIVGETTLHQCLRFMQKTPKAGALGVHMLNRDGTFAPESRRGLPTPATSFYKMSGLARLFPRNRRFGRYHMLYLDEQQPSRIDVISGAFFLARAKALAQVGCLDEDYFMYGEDVDLSYRLLCAGWENWYFPADILHYKGESTQKTSFRYVRNFYNAMLIFFRKHFAKRYPLATIIVLPAIVSLAATEILVRKFKTTFSAFCDRCKRICSRSHTDSNYNETIFFIGRHNLLDNVDTLVKTAGYTPVHQFSERVTYCVFDAEAMTYEDMFDFITKQGEKDFRAHLGIYHHSTNTIILPNDVISF